MNQSGITFMMPEEMQATIGTLLLFFAMITLMCLKTL